MEFRSPMSDGARRLVCIKGCRMPQLEYNMPPAGSLEGAGLPVLSIQYRTLLASSAVNREHAKYANVVGFYESQPIG